MANNGNKKQKPDLDSLLSRYDAHLNKVEKEIERKKTEDELFIERFNELQEKTIKPVFERLKAEFEKRGHKVTINTRPASVNDRTNMMDDPAIHFLVEMAEKKDARYDRYSNRDLPGLGFIGNVSAKKVWSHESTIGSGHGGHSGSKNTFTLEQITPEVVESEILEWFDTLLGEYRA